MKNRKGLFLLCLLPLLAACSASAPDPEPGGNKMEIPYQVIAIDQLPPSLAKQAQQAIYSVKEQIQLLSAGKKMYVILSLGEKRMAGYEIIVKKAEQQGSKLIIHASKKAPAENDFVAQVITYPAVILVIQPVPKVKHAEVKWL
ncbi:protease complex subunit PrcB family protein [Thermoactinomyces mirandus]|uniref:Protease complex subunit PrcB family protein n=1 Tax=Thermoactinomyces mirandus TaxID=2756294 RepID=A0A7W1XQY6_9BACL|nr:protease complex subunit PrcB family protein [Thermoactinomyces mirandus]MBA4601420.1 protease complex subunit PrcB family protein [Thermoactinomyces mirandus]